MAVTFGPANRLVWGLNLVTLALLALASRAGQPQTSALVALHSLREIEADRAGTRPAGFGV